MTAPAERIWVLRDPDGALMDAKNIRYTTGSPNDCAYLAISHLGPAHLDGPRSKGLRDDILSGGENETRYAYAGYTLTLEAHPRPSEVQS